MYYNPQIISGLDSLAPIERAYRAAGLELPTVAEATREALGAIATPDAVALDHIRRSLEPDQDVAAVIEQGIAAVARAQAAEQLRATFDRAHEALVRERLDELRDAAAKALTPVFKRTVKTLTAAASKLDPDDPLDRDRAFNTDTTAEYRAVTEALARLSALVFTTTHTAPPRVGTRLLPIVSIPDMSPELGTASRVSGWTPHRGQPGGRERGAIKALVRDSEIDLDRTITRVALGKYHGITLSLADAAELERRRQAFENATARIVTERSDDD